MIVGTVKVGNYAGSISRSTRWPLPRPRPPPRAGAWPARAPGGRRVASAWRETGVGPIITIRLKYDHGLSPSFTTLLDLCTIIPAHKAELSTDYYALDNQTAARAAHCEFTTGGHYGAAWRPLRADVYGTVNKGRRVNMVIS
jgi:hypothetical protein